MKWKFVYNGAIEAGTHISDLVKLVKLTGYKFFHHNGRVYFIGDKGEYFNTGIEIEDLI